MREDTFLSSISELAKKGNDDLDELVQNFFRCQEALCDALNQSANNHINIENFEQYCEKIVEEIYTNNNKILNEIKIKHEIDMNIMRNNGQSSEEFNQEIYENKLREIRLETFCVFSATQEGCLSQIKTILKDLINQNDNASKDASLSDSNDIITKSAEMQISNNSYNEYDQEENTYLSNSVRSSFEMSLDNCG